MLGPDHPHTLTTRANLAYWLGEAGQPAQAADQFRDLLNDFLRVLGPDHPDTLTTRGNLARWLGEAGQPDQAAAQYRDLLADYLRVLGPDHPDTLTTRDQPGLLAGQAGGGRRLSFRWSASYMRARRAGCAILGARNFRESLLERAVR